MTVIKICVLKDCVFSFACYMCRGLQPQNSCNIAYARNTVCSIPSLNVIKKSNNNQAVHTDGEVTANRPDIIIKNKKEKTCTDRCDNTRRQECCAKGSGKEAKIQEFMYRGTKNVEPEMYDYTNKNWSHWNSKEKLKEKSGSCTRKAFDRFTTKDSYIWNITHNTERCDKRHSYSMIIIIIIRWNYRIH